MKKLILAALAALSFNASAFSLDFTAYNGTNISAGSPLTIFVPGYGNVVFSTIGAEVLQVNNVFPPPGAVSLAILPTQTLFVNFAGAYAPFDIDDVSFGFTDLSNGDGLSITSINASTVRLTMGAGGNGAGLRDVNFSAVPEPSTTMLGAVGVLALALRRRRA